MILPMGNPSLVLPLTLPPESGACTLVWNGGFELHVCLAVPQAEHAPGTAQATIGLEENHLVAVTTNIGKALIVTGCGIRLLKRQRNRQLGQLAKKQSRYWKHFRAGGSSSALRTRRALVGSINMYQDASGVHVEFPRSFTYLRPGKTRARSSRADTPH